MTFTSMAPLLEQCKEHLDKIAPGQLSDANRFSICVQGLSEILTCLDEYDKNVVITRKFAESLAGNIATMLEELGRNDCAPRADVLDELAFQMVEELAVIVREKTMRSGVGKSRPGEEHVMDYFERRGFWFLGDQTLVTEYYYTGLPIALIGQMFGYR